MRAARGGRSCALAAARDLPQACMSCDATRASGRSKSPRARPSDFARSAKAARPICTSAGTVPTTTRLRTTSAANRPRSGWPIAIARIAATISGRAKARGWARVTIAPKRFRISKPSSTSPDSDTRGPRVPVRTETGRLHATCPVVAFPPRTSRVPVHPKRNAVTSFSRAGTDSPSGIGRGLPTIG